MAQSFCIKSLCLQNIPKNTVVVVAGPTASGKSDWAMDWAKKTEARIINGDSMQVYTGLDILTAMPSLQDQQRVQHDLYGIFSPYSNQCSVAQWSVLAQESIALAHTSEQRALVVGGTGFYLKTLMHGLSPIPVLDAVKKAELRAHHAQTSAQDLKRDLHAIDPISAEKFSDKQRLLHAWIVYTLTEKPLSFWHLQKPKPPSLNWVRILIWPSRDMILSRAEQRWEKMVQQGVYQEVASFCSNQMWTMSPLRKALGLESIHRFLQGDLSENACRQAYLIETAQYVKRQRTWFRGQFNPDYIYAPE